MRKNGFVVTFEHNTPQVPPQIISEHWTLEGAQRAFRKRNPQLKRTRANSGRLEQMGTFDRIRPVVDGALGEPLHPE